MATDFVSPPLTHSDAKEILALAYEDAFGVNPNHGGHLFALGIAQAIGLMEGGYGAKFHNNWGAITATPNADGSCPPGTFSHEDSSFELGKYTTCFRAYDTSFDGARDFIRTLYEKRPAVYEAALAGDIRGVAEEMYATNYYLGTAPPDQRDENGAYTNVNNYIAFIGKGVDDIADLYPSGGSSGDSGSSMAWILGVPAVIGLVALAKR